MVYLSELLAGCSIWVIMIKDTNSKVLRPHRSPHSIMTIKIKKHNSHCNREIVTEFLKKIRANKRNSNICFGHMCARTDVENVCFVTTYKLVN